MKSCGNIVGIMVFTFALAVGCFGFAQGAYAVYPSEGILASTNLLASEGASTISSFTANVSALPSGTGLRVSFSRDGSKWYSSTGAALGWDTLAAGANVIDLSGRGWSGDSFYYKMEFASDGSGTPVLDDISLAFTPAFDGVYQTYSTGGTLTSTNLLSGETVSLITGFSYEASAIPSGTSLKARFSRDGAAWYSSTGAALGWTTLAAGTNDINLSALSWTGANLYYQMQFTSDASDTPVLDSVNVAFGGIPDVSFQSGSVTVSEADGTVTLNLTLSESPLLQVSVPYTISGASTATLGSDYGVITGSPLILAPGETSTGIILNLTDDLLGEGNETVILTLGSPTNATLGSTGTLILTITSNDTPEVSFQSGSLTLSETSGTASILLTLSGSSARDITIPFSVSGTATGTGTDYTILTPSPLTLEAGETSTGILLRFVNDSSIESSETIILTLGTPVNAGAGGTGSVTITLTSDDVADSASSSSTSAGNTGGGGGGGGFRGSPSQMAARIAQARVTILARFEGKRQKSEELATTEQDSAGEIKQEERAAQEREARIAKRIAEHETAVAQSQKEQEELQKKYALHREERYAKALALQEEQLAEQQAALLAEREALQAEQDANRAHREERLKEQDRRTAQQILAEKEAEAREEQAAKEREDRIAQRIAEHEADIAQSQKEQEELQKKYALHREERYARALVQEQEHAAAAQTSLEEAQRALQEEQKANTERREERLAERKMQEQQAQASPQIPQTPRQPVSPEVVAARRGKLFAFVGDVPVIFKDVSLDEWYAPYISYVIEEKIATGYADEAGKPKGEFGVENPITYAEVLKMAMQASDQAFDLRDLPPPRNVTAKSTWAAAYVAKAEALNLIVFAPDLDVQKPATRGAVVQTILEVLGFPIPRTPATFADVPPSHPYSQAIGLAAYSGFVSGDTGPDGQPLNRFRPDDPINRAEVAKIIAMAKELLK